MNDNEQNPGSPGEVDGAAFGAATVSESAVGFATRKDATAAPSAKCIINATFTAREEYRQCP